MKALAFVLLTILVVACGDSEPSLSDLTAEERAAIALRYSRKCLSENTDNRNDYKTKAAEMFRSNDFARHVDYKSVWKARGNTSGETTTLQVWKQTASEIYFIKTTAGVANFLRITKQQNEEMIDALYTDLCNQVYTGDLKSSLALTRSVDDLPVGETLVDIDDVYSVSRSYPVGFANFSLTRHKHTTDLEDVVLTEEGDVYFESKIEAGTLNDFSLNTPPTVAGWCEFTTPYTLRASSVDADRAFPITCSPTQPAGWDVSI